MTIEPEADAAGHIRYLKRVRGLQQVHDCGVIAMAGEAAQRRFNSRSLRRYCGAGDLEAVVTYALEHVGSAAAAEAVVRLWHIQARDLIEGYWLHVGRLAEALLERRRLTEDECRAIMISVPKGYMVRDAP